MEYLESVNVNNENTKYEIIMEGNRYSLPIEVVNEVVEAGTTLKEAQEIITYLKNALTVNVQEQREKKYDKKRIFDAIEDCFDYQLIANIVIRLMKRYPFDMIKEMVEMIKPSDIVSIVLAGKMAQDEIIMRKFEDKVTSMVDYGVVVAESEYDVIDPIEAEEIETTDRRRY